jgi:hypothetical protein
MRRMRWVGNIDCMEDKRNTYNISIGKLKGKIYHRRLRNRWKNIIKTDLREIHSEGAVSIHPAQDIEQEENPANWERNFWVL